MPRTGITLITEVSAACADNLWLGLAPSHLPRKWAPTKPAGPGSSLPQQNKISTQRGDSSSSLPTPDPPPRLWWDESPYGGITQALIDIEEIY